MNEVSIPDVDKPQIQFQGDLIAQTDFNVDLGDQESRQFKLSVYGIAEGGYVAMIEFDSSATNERQVVQFDELDMHKDIENFFMLFEPWEIFRSESSDQRLDRRQVKPIRDLIADNYHTSMFRFLDLVESRANKPPWSDRVAGSTVKTSFKRIFGAKR